MKRTDMNTLGATPTIVYPPRKYRKRPGRLEPKPLAAATLTLISATYDPLIPGMTLTFDADINTDAMVLEAFEVNDADSNFQTLRGFTTTGLTANSVTIELEAIGPSTGTGTTLNVASGNGIVAVSDGSEWGGVTGLALPFE